jgi:hypothetical protein
MSFHKRKLAGSVGVPITLIIGTVALTGALLAAVNRQVNPAWSRWQDNPQVRLITPTLNGEAELCLTCHNGIEQISDSHPVDTFGCVVCHGGDRLSLDEEVAHTGLIGSEANPGNPADLSVVEVSCGSVDCHSGDVANDRDHIERVTRSVQASYAGAINALLDLNGLAQDGVYYGNLAVSDEDVVSPAAVEALRRFDPESFDNPAVTQFAEECLTCHVASQTVTDEPYYHRGTGCSSCHTVYARNGLYQGSDPTLSQTETGHAATHELTTAIPYTTCNHCHNRGTHDLETLTFTPRDDLDGVEALSGSERRMAELYTADSTHYAVCQYELDCIDCHTANEVMGDGDIYTNEADARRVECRTCHGTLEESPATVTLEDPNDVAFRRARLNPFYDVFVGNTVLLSPDGDAMGHIRVENDLYSLSSKVGGPTYLIPQVMGSGCEQDVERQRAADCQECHTYEP